MDFGSIKLIEKGTSEKPDSVKLYFEAIVVMTSANVSHADLDHLGSNGQSSVIPP